MKMQIESQVKVADGQKQVAEGQSKVQMGSQKMVSDWNKLGMPLSLHAHVFLVYDRVILMYSLSLTTDSQPKTQESNQG